MSNSMVRLAFDGSVACTPPSAPPVRFHRIHESTVPNASVAVGVDAAVAEQPLELRGGEVRVEHEPGPRPDQRLVALRRAARRTRRGAAVLPHERAVHGPAGGAVPRDHRLPLVGDPDRGDVGRLDPGDDVDERGVRRGPDVVGVVFDPAGRGKCWGNSR